MLEDNCVAHYKMNDNAANTVVVDSKGYSNGTAQQNTDQLHTNGKVGGALEFNGSSDYIDTNSTFNSIFQDSFSTSLWVKVISPDSGVLLGVRDSGNYNSIIIQVGNYDAQSYNVYVDYSSNNKQMYFNTSFNSPYLYSAWVSLIVTAKRQTNTWKIYVNGIQVDVDENTNENPLFTDFESNLDLCIGTLNDDGVKCLFSDSIIDNVMIFNKTLTPDEVATLYNYGRGTENFNRILPANKKNSNYNMVY